LKDKEGRAHAIIWCHPYQLMYGKGLFWDGKSKDIQVRKIKAMHTNACIWIHVLPNH